MADGYNFVGSYTITSDRRLKTNIRNIKNSLDKVAEIRGVSFNWDEKMEHIHKKRNSERKDLGTLHLVCN